MTLEDWFCSCYVVLQLYDALAVADTLSYLESWAEQFRADERPLPPSFDYPYLVDAFEVLISVYVPSFKT